MLDPAAIDHIGGCEYGVDGDEHGCEADKEQPPWRAQYGVIEIGIAADVLSPDDRQPLARIERTGTKDRRRRGAIGGIVWCAHSGISSPAPSDKQPISWRVHAQVRADSPM